MHRPSGIGAAQLDLLKELANIGVGNAVTALSTMLNDQRISMQVPEARVIALQDVPESIGDPESPVAATCCVSRGEKLSLVVLFVLPLSAAESVVSAILPGGTGVMGDMERSLLAELGNIITGAYLSALSLLTNLTFNSSPPRLAIDMAAAVLSTIIAETRTVDDQLVLLKTVLQVEDAEIEGSVLILPDSGSLSTFFETMGVG